MPNHPDRENVSVTYGPISVPAAVDTFAFLFSSAAASEHGHVISIRTTLVDDVGATVADVKLLAHDQRTATTLALGRLNRASVRLCFDVWFDRFEAGDDYGSIHVLYVLGYEGNILIDLLNEVGSDKGTTRYWGRGVPHCYGVEYHRLFNDVRHEQFAVLEIGLGNTVPPADAASLRAWRQYFPNAVLYGYDIEDFSFFSQPETFVFRGDQASRDDLRRFVATLAPPPFRVVIDDGSHASSHQQIALGALFPHVEPGGLYIVEDLGWQPFAEAPTTSELLRAFSDRGTVDSDFLTAEESRYLERTVENVEICRPNDSELAIIRKTTE